jgi:tRNA/rRNA methyltransferase
MLSIVLVRPQMAQNIGMVARVMLNFNISNLIIVNPKKNDFFDIANATSCEALTQLNLTVVQNNDINIALKEALQDIHNVFALTTRSRDLTKASFYINDMNEHIQENQNNAFLFGCERTGLTNNELSLANYIISINSNPNFPSLNLAQAVGICSYEYSKLQYLQEVNKKTKFENTNNLDRTKSLAIATVKENQHFLDDLFTRLSEKGFFKDSTKKEKNQHNIKEIFQKASLTSKEISILRGILKYLFDSVINK